MREQSPNIIDHINGINYKQYQCSQIYTFNSPFHKKSKKKKKKNKG